MISHEQKLLQPTDKLLDRAVRELAPGADATDGRLAVLEAVASVLGGWDLQAYSQLVELDAPTLHSDPGPWAEKIVASLADVPMPAPLALSALGREQLSAAQSRKSGAYYTDWQLAEILASECVPRVRIGGPWIDPACGSGILLVAAAMALPAGDERDEAIRHNIVGADLSRRALRATQLSLASLTEDLETIAALRRRLVVQDSLRSRAAWEEIAPDGAALVIANPPWEKLKITRHEVASVGGSSRHYGQSYSDDVDVKVPRAQMVSYVNDVVAGTRLQGTGEHDLYKLFLELGLCLAAEGGVLAMLVPAGLIRSQGTASLRTELDDLSRELHIGVIENRRRHFAIDTRFKFLAVVSDVGAGPKQPWSLRVADRSGALPTSAVPIARDQLREIRPDLSVPEVRSTDEWALFARLAQDGVRVGEPRGPWAPTYQREVDMTNDQHHFAHGVRPGAIPVIEGRHVAQFRNRAKAYRSGEGRAAVWEPLSLARASLIPQWFIDEGKLRPAVRNRTGRSRIGFCDITGQTNERTFLAARVSGGVVCGNKVPTIDFANGGTAKEDLFLALANSLVVDWMMRRLVTTTINFFLLDGLPLPPIDLRSRDGKVLVALARRVTKAEGSAGADMWLVGQWRARMDALIARAWHVDVEEMRLVLRDFPLLDRGQPTISGERQSSVTADAVLNALSNLTESDAQGADERLALARAAGALPYVSAEFVGTMPS